MGVVLYHRYAARRSVALNMKKLFLLLAVEKSQVFIAVPVLIGA